MKTEQQRLQRMISKSILPQVMLFHGTDREKGKSLLTWLLQRLHCQDVCGKCAVCQQIAAGKHTDTLYFDVSKEKKFGVSEASKLQEFLQVHSYDAARVAVIFDAHLMSKQAANKLLKTLEEPSGYVFLFSNQKIALLPTVRSRCFHFFIASTADVNLSYGKEVQAIFSARNIGKAIEGAKALKNAGCSVHEFLQAMEAYLHSMYVNQVKQVGEPSIHVRVRRLHLYGIKRLAQQQINLNLQLCVESLLASATGEASMSRTTTGDK